MGPGEAEGVKDNGEEFLDHFAGSHEGEARSGVALERVVVHRHHQVLVEKFLRACTHCFCLQVELRGVGVNVPGGGWRSRRQVRAPGSLCGGVDAGGDEFRRRFEATALENRRGNEQLGAKSLDIQPLGGVTGGRA